MRVIFAITEADPFLKTGGLGDVAFVTALAELADGGFSC